MLIEELQEQIQAKGYKTLLRSYSVFNKQCHQLIVETKGLEYSIINLNGLWEMAVQRPDDVVIVAKNPTKEQMFFILDNKFIPKKKDRRKVR